MPMPDDDLVGAQRDAEHTPAAARRAAPRGRRSASPSSGLPVAQAPTARGEGAGQHHALDAHVEHAGALADQFAGRRRAAAASRGACDEPRKTANSSQVIASLPSFDEQASRRPA